jgi:hypothetical protein
MSPWHLREGARMALPEALPFESPLSLGPSGIELVAVDLAENPLWAPEQMDKSGPTELDLRPAGFDSDDFVSPMGFSFSRANAREDGSEALRVSVQRHSDQSAVDRAVTRLRESGPVRTAYLACSEPRDAELTLVVGATGAEIFADDPAWAALAQPVLLCVAEYARYCAVERRFLKLQLQARRDHHHAVAAGPRTIRAQRRLTQTSLDVRDRVSDWTYFSGPAADPRRSCTSEEQLKACVTLAEELDIETWAKGIDELVEEVAQTYETLSDKLFHYRLFLLGAVLELVIVGLFFALLLR